MENPNTANFWDKKIFQSKEMLSISPIYIDKNRIISNYLRGSNGNFLDIGIGYGILENLLIKKSPKLGIFGIDISKNAIKEIISKTKGKFVVASALKIPFKISFFDYIVALDVLEHFQEKELLKILSEIRRVLKNEGTVIVSVPLNETLNDKNTNRHMISFTETDLKTLLVKNGFEILKTKVLYAFKDFYFIKSLVTRILKLRQPNLIIIFCKKK